MKPQTRRLIDLARVRIADAHDALPEHLPAADIQMTKAHLVESQALLKDAASEPVDDVPQSLHHPDDTAVDAFAAAMKRKLAEARAKGRGGWEDPQRCSLSYLAAMLVEQANSPKADPVDVGNFAMFLFNRAGGKETLQGLNRATIAAKGADPGQDE